MSHINAWHCITSSRIDGCQRKVFTIPSRKGVIDINSVFEGAYGFS